jgi:hypothetical protein
MRISVGCDAGQSRITGDSQHFTTGEEWVRRHTVIFSHAETPCIAVWPVIER